MESAVERWQALIDARQQQMDAAYARLGRTSADFWDRRARGFHRATKDSASADPFFLRVREAVTPQSTVLDVGAGTGRFSLALAPLAQEVSAIEPSATMLEFLRNDAQERGITNVSPVQATWQDAPDDLTADIVICSHVLYPIREIAPFLAKLRSATRRACFIYMRATSIDAATAHLWRHFHGSERCLQPGYIHALAVLYEMGIYANVEVVRFPTAQRYPSLDLAVDELSEQLILADDQHTRTELRKLLADWLRERNGELLAPVGEITCGILHFDALKEANSTSV